MLGNIPDERIFLLTPRVGSVKTRKRKRRFLHWKFSTELVFPGQEKVKYRKLCDAPLTLR